jgi:hypothetical protein
MIQEPELPISRAVTTVMIFATMLVSGGGMVAQRTMNPPIVSFCDLISNPDRHNGRIVSTKAIAVVTSFEVAYLYDLSATGKTHGWTTNTRASGLQR